MILQGPDFKKHVLVMVGLPARGKTFVARKIARYLSWLGYHTRTFNVGEYRRALAGAKQPAAFFDPDNTESRALRERIAAQALDDVLAWLAEGGEVALYDATNTERARREMILARCREANVRVVFIESICEDESVVDANVRENKLRSPDYQGVPAEQAVQDFRDRIAMYDRTYEPVNDESLSFVTIIDVGRQVVVNRMQGYLGSRLVFFLTNLHPTRRKIWLTRHGESQFNPEGRIGGDPDLSERGLVYAKSLALFINQRHDDSQRLVIWTSTLKRSIQTAEVLGRPAVARRPLDEIDAGVCDGMTYEEIRAHLADEFQARAADKFRYRYPRGESYIDVIQRLEPIIVDLERQRNPVLVIAHHAIVRALYAYLMGRPQEDTPHVPVPLHSVIELTPTAYGHEERRFDLDPRIAEELSGGPPSVGAPFFPPPRD